MRNAPMTATRADPEHCAALLLETAPLVMRAIRAQLRNHLDADLSVPQFRTLRYLRREPNATLSALAEHIGVTLPAASRMVDGLVARGYIERRLSAADRRSIDLSLSEKGEAMLDASQRQALLALSEQLGSLSEDERHELAHALETLRGVFAPGGAAEPVMTQPTKRTTQ